METGNPNDRPEDTLYFVLREKVWKVCVFVCVGGMGDGGWGWVCV